MLANRRITHQSERWVDLTRDSIKQESLKKLIYAVILLDRLILTNKTSPLLRLELYPTKRRKERKL